jgi:acetylornithine/N-succinyldiaminopimelate aminotransferase
MAKGIYFRDKLKNLPKVKEVRGKGLMIGVEFEEDIAMDIKYKAADAGLLITAVRPSVIRLVPPLNVSTDECDRAYEILEEVITKL